MTQAQLGEKLGVSGATISNYETGYSHFTADDVFQIADALGIAPAAFFESEPEPADPYQQPDLTQFVHEATARWATWPPSDREFVVALADQTRDLLVRYRERVKEEVEQST